MAFQISGKIELIGEIISKPSKNGGQPFQSREFVIDATRFNPETGEPWENHPRFELSSRNVNIIEGFQVGQRVTVDFSLRGAKYVDQQTGETKYFTSINAFRITAAEQAQPTFSSQSQPTFHQPAAQDPQYEPMPMQGSVYPPKVDGSNVQAKDDLPF